MDSPSPCIALEMGPESGRVGDLPFTAQTFNVYCYARTPAASMSDFTVIDKILKAVRDVLHGASLTLDGQGKVAFDCAWDNYSSGDNYDERRRAFYRYERYRVWMVLTTHYH